MIPTEMEDAERQLVEYLGTIEPDVCSVDIIEWNGGHTFKVICRTRDAEIRVPFEWHGWAVVTEMEMTDT